MKKFYLLTLSALTAVAVNAQKNGASVKKQTVFAVEQQPNQKPARLLRKRRFGKVISLMLLIGLLLMMLLTVVLTSP